MTPRLASLATLIAAITLTAGCAARSQQSPPVAATTPPSASPATPAPAAAPPPPAAERPDLEPVFFGYDSHALTAEARTRLDRVARLAREHADMSITVEGHCDERGTVEYNLALGEKRAGVVRDYLTSAGIAAARLHTVSYGKERPFSQGHDERAWAQNRRAHLVGR